MLLHVLLLTKTCCCFGLQEQQAREHPQVGNVCVRLPTYWSPFSMNSLVIGYQSTTNADWSTAATAAGLQQRLLLVTMTSREHGLLLTCTDYLLSKAASHCCS